jgi:hypothetical protein
MVVTEADYCAGCQFFRRESDADHYISTVIEEMNLESFVQPLHLDAELLKAESLHLVISEEMYGGMCAVLQDRQIIYRTLEEAEEFIDIMVGKTEWKIDFITYPITVRDR